jgi:ATP-dependent DNA helicase Rep
MKLLNPEQLAAVHYIDGPLLVLAGAGSGKTSVITQKIAYLIQDCQIKPHNIVAVTFTNKAAQEMSDRVSKHLGNEKSIRGLNISTFHRFGLKFIQTEHETLGFRTNLSIFDTEDSLSLLRELLIQRTEESKEKLESFLQAISRFKNAGLDPEEAIQAAANPFEFSAAKLYIEYQRYLKVYNAVDFDDLILLPLKALTQQVALREKWQNKIHYLLVDEYQDTNQSQYALVRLLTGVRGALTVVGDDHQSIYTWRGARADNLIHLQKDFLNLKIIKLEQNYRSTTIILRAANQLISNNPSLFSKNLWSQLGMGDRIRVLSAYDEEQEANRVAASLLSHKFQNSGTFRDYAILYRSNHQSRAFEKALREHRVPYQVSGGISFFSRSEIKDIISYLKVLVNPDDDCAFLRIVNVPKREIGASTLEKLGNYAKQRELSLFAASFELGLEQTLTGKSLERLKHFTEWLVLTADNAVRGDTFAVIQDMIKQINYEGWILDNASHPKTAEKKIENVNDFLNWLKRLFEPDPSEVIQTSKQGKTLAEVVHTMVLMDILDRNQDNKPADCVQLMTLHAAKGLEFPHVFLTGLEEEILPHRTSIEEKNIEEERRLAYVGMTRAKRNLTLSLARQRRRHSQLVDSQPSRFLQELPREDLIWDEDKAGQSIQEKEQEGKAHLSAIRGLLSAGKVSDPI